MPELKQLLDAKPANGYQIILPEVKNLAPGSDNEFCTWTDLIVNHDVSMRAVQAFQTLTGHHVIMYTTSKLQPPGTTRLCTDDDMATFRFGAGAGGEGMGGKNEAPGNLVFPVPAGTQIVLNHHYINATTQPHDAQSAINIWLADPGQTYVDSASLALLDSSIRLPPGAATVDIDCVMPREMKAWLAIPHMHQYGTRITIVQTSGANTSTLFDVDPWSPSYMFHPPELTKDPTTPLVFAANDSVHVHCEWNNPKATALTFGLEMCVAFMQTVDAEKLGNLQCDAGKWGPF
jgi:hypothetical protein